MSAITKRQHEVLDAISGFIESTNYSPSYEELGQILGIKSLATVHKHIQTLKAKGFIRVGFNRSRSIELIPKLYTVTPGAFQYKRGYDDGYRAGVLAEVNACSGQRSMKPATKA